MKLSKALSLLLCMVMIICTLPIVIGASELPLDGNKIDITDKQIGPYTLKYLEVYLQGSLSPVSIVSAEQNGTVIDIALSPDTDPSAKLQVGFSGTGAQGATLSHVNNKCSLSGGNGTMNCTVKAILGQPRGDASYTINFSLVAPAGPSVKFTSNLSEAEAVYVQGKPATPLSVAAEYTGITDNAVTYQWYSNSTKSTEGGMPIENATDASYTPFSESVGTVYYYVVATCEGKSAASKIATVTVEADLSPESGLWLGIETSNGSVNLVRFTDVNGEKIEGLYSELDSTSILVMLPHSYSASGKVTATFELTQNNNLPFITTTTATSGRNDGKAVNNIFTEKKTTLNNGSAGYSFYLYNAVPSTNNNKYTAYTVKYAIKNEAPTLADGQEATGSAEIISGESYTIDLAPIFTDADGDTLAYSVKINGEAAAAADANYSFAPTLGGTYTLEFFASDFMSTSAEPYTVMLEVTNSTVTYDMTALLPSDITPVFYITNGYENGVDALGEALVSVAGEAADGYIPYTVTVPENISEISVRDANYGGMALSAASGSTVTLRKIDTVITDFSDKPISGTVSVSYGEKKAVGVNGKFLLVTDWEYKFSETPQNTSKYNAKTETLVLDAATSEISIEVAYKNPKTVKTTTGASAKFYRSSGNYFVYRVYEPEITVDNGDGTSTHYFATEDSGPGVFSYRVSMDGKLTKAGYLITGNSVTVLHGETDKLPADRVDYTTAGTNAAENADDSVLLNINQQNHLSLALGATKTLKAYRVWQIITHSYENHIIEPDFHFNILSGEDVVALTPYDGQPLTNSSGNWRKLTAIGEGTAVMEVTYDAIDVKGGSYEGFYGAADPARTGLFVVTVGENVPKVDFGIECKTGAGSMVYAVSNAKHWDAEFDTLYFLGENGEIRLSPSFAHGIITEVAVSGDKGVNYTVLEETDGVYIAPIVSGNSIIRVTTDKGVAYQIVRGDKVELALKNETHPDKPICAGDEVSLKLVGVHTPIPKIAGTYNPGYRSNLDGDGGVHLHYSFGEDTIISEGRQYDFSLYGTTVRFTVPADSEETEFTLTDGYIGVGVIGVTAFPNDGESHRNIPDAGGTTRGSETTFHTRSLLPDITVSIGMLPSGNTAPFIRETAPQSATLNLGNTYAISMSRIFTDRDGDTLTYTAKVGDGEAAVCDEYYTFTPDSVGTYTITFVANDGRADSDAHTVTLTVKEKQSTSTSSLKFDIEEDDIVGYVKISFIDKGKRVEGEQNIAYPKALATIISTKKVPFANGDTVADVTIRLLDALEYTYEYTGTTKNGFYLASIGGFTLGGIEYNSLGEFDCGSGSGWMITLNGEFIEYGASDFEVKNSDTVKWQYTCQLGADIGDPFYSDNTSSASKTKEEKKDDVKKFTYTKDTYSDVSADAWYYEAAKYTYEYGLIQGMDGKFNADGEMTRAMLVTVLYRLDGENKTVKQSGFTDVPENEWYADAVAWAAENGIVYGISESEFAPDANITREQLVAVIYRYAKFKGLNTEDKANLVGYMDSDEISDYAADAYAWMVYEKLVGGTSELTLSPKDAAIRGHIAKIAMNIREMSK